MREYGVERDRSWVEPDPLLVFVLDGVRFSLKHNTVGKGTSDAHPMTWEEGRDLLKTFFPDAEFVIPELEDT